MIEKSDFNYLDSEVKFPRYFDHSQSFVHRKSVSDVAGNNRVGDSAVFSEVSIDCQKFQNVAADVGCFVESRLNEFRHEGRGVVVVVRDVDDQTSVVGFGWKR